MVQKNILVTGGLGFIGSNFIRLFHTKYKITILDKKTYAANSKNIEGMEDIKLYIGDIGDANVVKAILIENKINIILNFAAESHVDNSIMSPNNFIYTNIVGTYNLLEVTREYIHETKIKNFKFVHISTDEVYGSLDEKGLDPFTEDSKYMPNSPYSASKASSDMLVRAWYKTYGLPVIITNCSNNYGPYQHKEKLIPTVIKSAINHLDIPLYGNGSNIRDWIHVDDHCRGIHSAMVNGMLGEQYLFGGSNEINNMTLVRKICDILDNYIPSRSIKSYKGLIKCVGDRLGHDFRYSVNSAKASKELNFKIAVDFEKGLETTVKWYLDNREYL